MDKTPCSSLQTSQDTFSSRHSLLCFSSQGRLFFCEKRFWAKNSAHPSDLSRTQRGATKARRREAAGVRPAPWPPYTHEANFIFTHCQHRSNQKLDEAVVAALCLLSPSALATLLFSRRCLLFETFLLLLLLVLDVLQDSLVVVAVH